MSICSTGERVLVFLEMIQGSYKAILEKDRVRWTGRSPDAEGPLEVCVTVLGSSAETDVSERGQLMAKALEEVAARGGIKGIGDPVEWQHELRQDTPLPGREE